MMDLAFCQGNSLSGYESFGHAANVPRWGVWGGMAWYLMLDLREQVWNNIKQAHDLA